MQILHAHSPKLQSQTAVSLGMFDGVHLGHREVIQAALNYAQSRAIKTAVITLANHPRLLTKGTAPKLITNLDTRLALFEELGIDYALVLEFDEELMNTSAQDYLEKYLINILNVEFISMGYDHHFGKNRSGTPSMLQAWAAERSIKLDIIAAHQFENQIISSSHIRELVTQGKLEEANRLLGYKFMIISQVIEGDKRGAQLGFPTANLKLPEDMVIPAKGVYCGQAQVYGETHPCIMNIGTRPSFTDSNEVIIEAHILNFKDNIYGGNITLRLERKLRDEIKFDSAESLVKQIKKDIEQCSSR
jgi:riboflavin kinase/FMN adenylyltransferase